METQRRKQHNFTENNMWALLWHGLPMAALLLWGAFCITNSLWYDEAYSASMVSLPWKRLIYITATSIPPNILSTRTFALSYLLNS